MNLTWTKKDHIKERVIVEKKPTILKTCQHLLF